MNTGRLFIISAPSGAGKTSLVNALCEQLADIRPSVSHTTRQKRPAETNGVDYHFISEEQFKEKQDSGDFLESARVFDYFYGTSASAVKEALDSGTDIILEIDWQGARQIRKTLDFGTSIYILPPSTEVLEQRLRKRDQDDADTIRRRMRAAVMEMVHYDEFDYLIVNDDFDQALNALSSIVIAQRCKTEVQSAENRDLIKSLLA